ncbi:MAG: uncharacterized protein KVP18_004462 [Porospora cf. gigantea A]|uniref:uncharacterized protein n=1 Tax=Porospora cf. gigantea A TaxID=2853593 RepID=UPI00355980BC|nr:MAG: hypothetical protein KVP18_004462 [Porospora cf. gigantea A]
MKLFSLFLLGVGISCTEPPTAPPDRQAYSRPEWMDGLDQQADYDDSFPDYSPENMRRVSRNLRQKQALLQTF